MKPKHQAIVAGLALSLTLGVAAPIPMFAQTDTVQQQDIAGNANADPITDVDAKQPAPSDYDPADEYSEVVDPSPLMTLSLNSIMATSSSSLQPKALSSEMKYFAQNESGSNYNLGFSYGDGYHAMGFYQFDRRYALVDFMQECYNYNPQKYGMFKAVIDRGSELKRDADDVIYDKKTHKLTELGQLAEDAWHAAYAADPQEFSALQDAYGYQEYYLPVERIVRKYGLDLSGRADCLKGLCWGMNNLFGSGGCQKFFKMANLSNDMSDEQAVTAICDALIDYMTNTSTNQYAASYANRYEREKKTCLTYLAQHKTENDANKDTSGSGSDTGSDVGAGSGSGAGSDSNNGSGSGTGSDSGTGSGSGSTDQPSQGEGSAGGGSSAAGGTVTTPAGGSTTGSPNAPSTDMGTGSTSSPSTGGGADSGDGSTSGGSSSSNAPSGTPSDSAAGSNGSADADGDSGDDAGDANGGATNGDTSDNGASSGAGTQGSGSTSLPSTDGKPDGGKDGADSKDDGGKGQGDKGINGQGKAMAKAGADRADTKSDEVEKLPATADASTIGLVVSAALSLSGVGAVVVGKRRSAEKVPFEDGFRG
ncbi:LPXTG cell wall anchor domain-containing protein [Collinsella bouchesdurhonensis]|uniref:LPXTG cell wall anchor domain-containing protein n=1 Tax=Collinsella bouchesdurhonensis TaxID=1907654 RepID=UPI002A7D9FB3|nr:LPXTG cell wall anchor domain-containing protein [Collinsella bouchesdurhonensis]